MAVLLYNLSTSPAKYIHDGSTSPLNNEIIPICSPTPEPSPSPTPYSLHTAEPQPTELPFSYYAPTTEMSFHELVGDNERYEMPRGYPKEDTYYTIVDKTHQVVLVYTKDANGEYTIPVRYMLCSTGKRTPEGIFQMKRYRVRFGFFQNDKTYGQYWSLINGRIYFHSILYTERNNSSSYIKETYDLLGTPASHGCIRLPVPDARFLYYNLAYGSVVEIIKGDPEDEATKAIRKKLILAASPNIQQDFSTSVLPDTDNWNIDKVKIEIPYEEGSQKGQE